MRVEIWSDVVCPWCYIGKRRFEQALATIAAEGDDLRIGVSYRPFQLDPKAPPGATTPVIETYARKFGGYQQAQAIIDRVTAAAAGEDLEFHLDRAQRANTLLAHRLLWWAERPDSPIEQAALKERLLAAYFTDGRDVGDPDVLAGIAAELGADRSAVREMLDGDEGVDDVAVLLREAAAEGITAVPTYVIDGAWAVPGAQDPDVFVKVLRKLANRARAS